MVAEPVELVTVGRIERSFGVRGEVKVRSLSDVPGRLESLGAVSILGTNGKTWDTRVTHIRPAGQGFILALEGLTSPEAAGLWRGGLIQIPKGSAPPLPQGQYYECDLIGLRVQDEQGNGIGTLTDIWELSGNHVFVVQDGSKETLIPAARDLVVAVDLQQRVMTVHMIEGLERDVLHIDVLTLFPEMILQAVGHSMLKRAQEKGLLTVQAHNLRDYTMDRHKVSDDVPYGGGAGMVMKAEPILRAVDALRAQAQSCGEEIRLMFPSPQGRTFTQEYAKDLAAEPRRIVILCGHYEGVDERVREALRPEEVSVGDYILTGGELPALVLIDAATRLVPGVLGDPESVVEESFSDSLLEYPHYTRPADVRGMGVPDVLLSGHHEAIRLWRRKQALRSTYARRPDLIRDRSLSREDQRLLSEIISEGVVSTPV